MHDIVTADDGAIVQKNLQYKVTLKLERVIFFEVRNVKPIFSWLKNLESRPWLWESLLFLL
jgi:hypothetical protein